jgi:hypothetical protein
MPNVTVSVATGGIICNPDPVPVSGADATITFTLATPGYNFPASNAIVVPAPSNQFPNPSVTVTPTTATLLDKNTDDKKYKYIVNLVRTSDNQPLDVDPIIENGK